MPTGKVRRVHTTEDHVGVGDGRFGPAPPIRSRARFGARALRPDTKAAGFLVSHRAAARPDGVDVDHRQQEREPLHFGLGRNVGEAINDEAHVEARPAHINADEVSPAQQAGQ